MHPNDTILNDYVDAALDEAERSGVEEHLARCPACRQTVEDLRDILRASGELELREPPVRAWPRLERAIKVAIERAVKIKAQQGSEIVATEIQGRGNTSERFGH